MPKILGMEPKTAMWVGGGIVAAILVVFYLRSRGGGDTAAAPAGADQGFGAGAYSPSAPASGGAYGSAATPGGDAASEFERQFAELQLTGLKEQINQAGKMFDLQYASGQQQLAFAGQYGQQQLAASGAETERYVAATNAVTNVIKSGKIKPECGKGESSYIDPNTGQWACKKAGKSGIKSAGDTLGQAGLDVATGYVRSQGPQFLAGLGQPKPQRPQYSGGTVLTV